MSARFGWHLEEQLVTRASMVSILVFERPDGEQEHVQRKSRCIYPKYRLDVERHLEEH